MKTLKNLIEEEMNRLGKHGPICLDEGCECGGRKMFRQSLRRIAKKTANTVGIKRRKKGIISGSKSVIDTIKKHREGYNQALEDYEFKRDKFFND